jgi:hypothetical protein
MDNLPRTSPPYTLLSQEELQLLLGLLQAEALPGLDRDSFAGMSPEQKSFALLVAERALRARELAVLDRNDGRLLVNRDLLDLLAACCAPERMILTQQIAAGAQAGQLFNAYAGGQLAIAHLLPQEGLHLFLRMPDWTTLRQEVLNVCECQSLPGAPPGAMTLAAEVMRAGRDLAAGGKPDEAARLWSGVGADPAVAERLAGILAAPHRLVLFSLARRQPGKSPEVTELTLLRDDRYSYEMRPAGGDGGKQLIQPATTPGLQDALV